MAEGQHDVRVVNELNENQGDLILAEDQHYVRLEIETNDNTGQGRSSEAEGRMQ